MVGPWGRSLAAPAVLAVHICSVVGTFKGFVNPMKHYSPEKQSFFILNVSDGESAEEIQEALSDFSKNQERYHATVGRLSEWRVGRQPCHPTLVDTQNVWPTVQHLAQAGFPVLGRYVNIGAHDGHNDDPLFEYARQANATGVAVEQNPERCEKHRQALPQVNVACSAVTPQNVASLVADVIASPPIWLDVLKVDIDSYDCPVLESLLGKVHARVVLIEANPSIPPPYQWAMLHHPDLWPFFNSFSHPEEVPIRGCSLAYEIDLLARFGYDFIAFGGHDAVFTHRSVRSAWLPLVPPMDEFDCFNEAFIAANGIPIQKTRRWFFELDDVQVGLPEIWTFFSDWMKEHAPMAFPFALRLGF